MGNKKGSRNWKQAESRRDIGLSTTCPLWSGLGWRQLWNVDSVPSLSLVFVCHRSYRLVTNGLTLSTNGLPLACLEDSLQIWVGNPDMYLAPIKDTSWWPGYSADASGLEFAPAQLLVDCVDLPFPMVVHIKKIDYIAHYIYIYNPPVVSDVCLK